MATATIDQDTAAPDAISNAPQDADDPRPVSKLSPSEQFEVLKRWWRADADHSREWRREARDSFGFRAGEQLSPEDKAALDEKNRPHIVFNRVLLILKAVAGMEINGRHEISFIPRKTEDTAVNELLTGASKWMADNCDGEDEESQAFEDCCTCGMGWTESRMSFEDDEEGSYIEESVDPIEMYWDRTARKKNISDARRMSRVRRMPFADATAMFPGKTRLQLDARWADDNMGDYPERTLEERRIRDAENSGIDPLDDQTEVTIVNMQWIEKEPYWLVADLQTNRKVALSTTEYQQFSKRMQTLAKMVPPEMAGQFQVHAVRMVRKVYKSAFLGGELLQEAQSTPIDKQFSWACITGERDAEKKVWFGLVRPMRDPQMWANKWLAQILHILNTTAKGGILAEEDAFEDQREAENSYAQADTITYVANGALSGEKPRILPKPGAGDPAKYVDLLQFAVSSIRDVIGVNLELLGQQDMQQPGVVEMMRKQAGMTVLATLFDSLRRFRKIVGRKRLFFIQNYLSDGRIIRVAGQDEVKALPLLKQQTLGEYDVVVDDTPTSPNQKEANWAIIQPLLAVFKDQLVANPEIFAMLLEYSPLPNRVVEAIKSFIGKMQQNPDSQVDKNLQRQLIISEITKNQSTAEMQDAKAGATQQTALYDFAMAKHMLESGQYGQLKAHLDAMEASAKVQAAQSNAVKAGADADHSRAKAAREVVGTKLDLMNARRQHADQQHQHGMDAAGHHREMLGHLVDSIGAVAGAHRDMAAAAKDRAQASIMPVQAQTERLQAHTQAHAARSADHRNRAAAEKDRVAAARDAATPIQQPGMAGQQ
jgi:hypothetical protein